MNSENYIEDTLSDEELWIDKEDHSIYPIDRDRIQVTVNNTVIFSIIQYIIRWDIELQPNFQRSYVWDDEKAEKLIDSVWNWLPIPQLFLLTKKDWNQLVIDWQQRLTSLIRFMLDKDKLKDVLPDTTFWDFHNVDELQLKVSKSIFTWNSEDKNIKITFSELDKDIQRKFEWESLIIAQIKPTYSLFIDKEDDLEMLSKEIFYRLNTWWVKLTSQEIRHSLYHKDFMKQLKDISFSDNWRKLIPTWTQKFKNDPSLLWEMLLRAFSLLDTYAKENDTDTIWKILDNYGNKFIYFKPLNKFLDKYASVSDKFESNYVSDRIDILNKLLAILNVIFIDESLFKHQNIINTKTGKPRSNSFNIKYIDTLFVGLLNLFRYKINFDNETLKNKILEFKSNSEFIEEHVSKPWTADPKYVEERVSQSIDFFEQLNNN